MVYFNNLYINLSINPGRLLIKLEKVLSNIFGKVSKDDVEHLYSNSACPDGFVSNFSDTLTRNTLDAALTETKFWFNRQVFELIHVVIWKAFGDVVLFSPYLCKGAGMCKESRWPTKQICRPQKTFKNHNMIKYYCDDVEVSAATVCDVDSCMSLVTLGS